jgi:predicted MPP superfamily phosphohydrolase
MMQQYIRKVAGRRARGRLTRAITRPPFHDELGRKGWLAEISRAQRHVIRRLHLEIAGWPQWRRPLRVAFLSDLHTGSHSDDVVRLNAIVHDVAALAPDLVLYGGDYVNMQPFGGGRVPPRTIAAILSRLEAPLGRFAILGNHDYVYGARAVIDALEDHGIPVLDHARRSMRFQNHAIDLVGVPDAGMTRAEAYALLAGLSAERPTIVLAHDPVWFAHLPTGPHFMLAGHTHGGQIRLPGIGIVRTATKAPRRWAHGLVEERGQYLYVTSGIGTSGLPLRWGVPPEIVVLETAGKHRT